MTPAELKSKRHALDLPGRDPLKASYFAGLIDGEGNVRIRRRDRSSHGHSFEITPHVEVRMTCRATIQALANYFGGSVNPVKVASGRKPQWRWRAASERARSTLREIRPYLITKAAEADEVLAGSMPRKPLRTPESTKRSRAADGKFVNDPTRA